MSRDVIRQAIVASLLIAIVLIVLLVSAPTTLRNVAGAHPAHTGVMLIAPAYQHQYRIEYKV